MIKMKWLAVLVCFLILVLPCFAAGSAKKLLGTWKLVSFEVVWQATGERELVWGKNPAGYMIFTSQGRMMVLITAEGRKPAQTNQNRADLFKSMAAYTCTYRVEGDKYFVKYDVAQDPAWVGLEVMRLFTIDGDRLQVTTMYVPPTPRPEKKGPARSIATYERAK
jgi:hypothetical protein